jgi:hypothetical protein
MQPGLTRNERTLPRSNLLSIRAHSFHSWSALSLFWFRNVVRPSRLKAQRLDNLAGAFRLSARKPAVPGGTFPFASSTSRVTYGSSQHHPLTTALRRSASMSMSIGVSHSVRL